MKALAHALDETPRKDIRWWLNDDETLPSVLFDRVSHIWDRSIGHRESDLYSACLYDDDSVLSGFGGSYESSEYQASTIAVNVVRQNVDTVAAKVSRDRPLPKPVLSDATFGERERARFLAQCIEGQFDTSDVPGIAPTIARDAALFGNGLPYVDRVGKKIFVDRLLPGEFLVDDVEAVRGKPRCAYIRRWIDKSTLKAMYASGEDDEENAVIASAIEAAGATARADGIEIGYREDADQALVVTGWHLRSGDDADDGWKVVCVEGKLLAKQAWKRSYFPVPVLRMMAPIAGFWGVGFGRMLQGRQFFINEMMTTLRERTYLTGRYLWVPEDSDIQEGHLDNGSATVLKGGRVPPQVITGAPMHPMEFQILQWLEDGSFRDTGVSQLSAHSEVPAGMQQASGVALNTFLDENSERFGVFVKAYERMHVDIANIMIDLWEEISEEFGGLKIAANDNEYGQSKVTSIDFKNVKLDRERMKLRVVATNSLARDPAARRQELFELEAKGWLTTEEAMERADVFDRDGAVSMRLAGSRLIDKRLYEMLHNDPDDPDTYKAPEPFQDFDLCMAKGLQVYLEAEAAGAPEENLELVQRYILDARNEKEKLAAKEAAKAAALAPQGPMGGAPPPEPGLLAPDAMAGAAGALPDAGLAPGIDPATQQQPPQAA
ncbi:MAG: hypothetical protein M3Q61_04615 [Chloroflexota bacterium]|nr:hypothetical protein [Chloroflexota bacterium]